MPSRSWWIDRPAVAPQARARRDSHPARHHTTTRPAPANGRGPSAQSGGAYKKPRLRHGIPAPHRHRARAATATS
jgi:hypothetical protein